MSTRSRRIRAGSTSRTTCSRRRDGIGTRYERYPADPTGIREPHDTLAAEEFALPVPEQAALTAARRARDRRRWLLLALLAVAATPVLWCRRLVTSRRAKLARARGAYG